MQQPNPDTVVAQFYEACQIRGNLFEKVRTLSGKSALLLVPFVKRDGTVEGALVVFEGPQGDMTRVSIYDNEGRPAFGNDFVALIERQQQLEVEYSEFWAGIGPGTRPRQSS
jgi:hypothetical protein